MPGIREDNNMKNTVKKIVCGMLCALCVGGIVLRGASDTDARRVCLLPVPCHRVAVSLTLSLGPYSALHGFRYASGGSLSDPAKRYAHPSDSGVYRSKRRPGRTH